MRVIGGVAFLLCAFIFHASAKTPCSRLLAERIEKVINLQKTEKDVDLSHFLDRDFSEKLKAYYTRAPIEEVHAKARETLSNLLADTDFLIEPALRKAYLYSLQHFLDRGGRFVIDLEMNDFTLQTDIVAVRNPAYEFIRVPLYLLLYVEIDVPNAKENLLRDLTHELRHSITDERTRRRLKDSGVTVEPDYIYVHIGSKDVNQSIGYAYMLENDAIRAQENFVPQASNNTGDLNLYPELQSLQRLLHTFTYKDLAELEDDISKNRQFKILSTSLVDHYIQHIETVVERELLPPRIQKLLPKLDEGEVTLEKAMQIALEDFDSHTKSIEGRLNEELSTFLRGKIEALFRIRQLRIRRAYQQLLDEKT